MVTDASSTKGPLVADCRLERASDAFFDRVAGAARECALYPALRLRPCARSQGSLRMLRDVSAAGPEPFCSVMNAPVH
jgi:hypothetical protein